MDIFYKFYIKIGGKYISLSIYKVPIRPNYIIKENIDPIDIYELNTIIFNFIYKR